MHLARLVSLVLGLRQDLAAQWRPVFCCSGVKVNIIRTVSGSG